MPLVPPPELWVARLLPRAIFTGRSYRLARRVFALAAGLAPGRGETTWLATGQRLVLHRPPADAAPGPALLWIHGGGLAVGDPRLDGGFCARLAALGLTVAAPAYRFVPEHPFPAALDDVTATFDWLAARPDIDPARIAVGGDSAGGGLAACLALRLSARDGVKPRFQLLHEPMLDNETGQRPVAAPKTMRIWSAEANRWSWSAYLANLAGPVPATASAARATDAALARLPPAWLGVGGADLFRAEVETYATRLAAAGVGAETELAPGAFHGFLSYAPWTRLSRAYLAAMRAALTRGLDLAPGSGDT